MIDRVCPYCGSPLKENAISCPECGSDEKTGWSDEAPVDWELPDYDEIVQNEFQPTKKNNILIFVISILLLIAIGLSLLFAL